MTAPRAPEQGLNGPATRQSFPHDDSGLRRRVGEFVGNIFYGTLLRQIQASRLKSEYLSGGRGEEVFQGQLGMEFAKRLGRAVNDPLSNKLYESIRRHLEKTAGVNNAPATHETPEERGEA